MVAASLLPVLRAVKATDSSRRQRREQHEGEGRSESCPRVGNARERGRDPERASDVRAKGTFSGGVEVSY